MLKTLLIKAIQWPIRLYVLVISPWLGANCRFQPTCSAYTLKALERHGVLKGLFLGLRRLSKCHPWGPSHWHDPVPDEFHWIPKGGFDWRARIGYKRGNQKQKAPE